MHENICWGSSNNYQRVPFRDNRPLPYPFVDQLVGQSEVLNVKKQKPVLQISREFFGDVKRKKKAADPVLTLGSRVGTEHHLPNLSFFNFN